MLNIDVATLVTLVEPGSCFVGTLAELVFASDRSYMLIGEKQGDNRAPAEIVLSSANFGPYPMSHGLTRLESRFQADPSDVETAKAKIGEALDAEIAEDFSSPSRSMTRLDDEVRVFSRSAAASRRTASQAWRPAPLCRA